MEAIASRVPGLEAELSQRREAEARAADQLQAVLSSGTWRAMRPVRDALGQSPRMRRAARRTAKAVWWTVTLQLLNRLAARRAATASLTAPSLPVPAPADVSPLQREIRVPAAPLEARAVLEDVAAEELHEPAAPPEAKAVLGGFAAEELREFLAKGELLRFRSFPDPDVSILIAVWNKAHFTLRCLRALLAAEARIEVIVVDNASSDETTALLALVEGVHVIRNEANEGFLLATNRAAAAARGRELLLLNNDAFVRPGSIDAAIATLRSAPDIGAVGGRLILPDGKLQEAGSIIWSDGSTLGYARGAEPEAGEAMFRRDVDYCSGAFLLTPRATWERLGGFNSIYAPAYYEEADYCLRLREAGLRIVFEPDAVADHFEFGSENKQGDAVALSIRNRGIFRRQHGARLLAHHLPPAPSNVLVARHAAPARARRRLLVVDDFVPLNTLGSGFPRTRELLAAAVALGWSVTFYPTNQAEVDWPATRREISQEVEIVVNGGSTGLPSFLAARSGYFDTALISRPHNMGTLKETDGANTLARSGTRVIYDAEALFSLREIEQARVQGAPLTPEEADGLIRSELALCGGSDAVVCVSEEEAKIFRGRLPGPAALPVHILSHPTTAREGAPGFDARHGFLFVGRLLEKTAPNWDGLSWFVRECWPAVREALPDATLTVAGQVDQDHGELLQPGVRLVGPVDDLGPLYDAARVFIAPIRFAAGVPIKILEAIAAGLPCAGTRLMARQMNFKPGAEMVAEDDARALACGAVALHRDASAWATMRDAAGIRVRLGHGADRFREALRRMLDEPVTVLAEAACAWPGGSPAHQISLPPSDAHRIARVAAVWGGDPPQTEAEQWSRFPLSHPVVKATMNKRATGSPERDGYWLLRRHILAANMTLPIVRAVSLCCGAGAVERDLVRRGLISRCTGYDLALDAISAARAAATHERLEGLEYAVRDLERVGLDEAGLDLIVAHQGVHHLSRLETVLDAVRGALHVGGLFHVDEFVGPDRFQWTDRQLEEMTAWVRSLPERYRMTAGGLIKDSVGRATIAEMIAYDPSEAVRSSDIERLISEKFEILERRPLGGTLAMMALAEIGHNFDPASAEAVAHLERLLRREEELIAAGDLGSDFVVLIARRRA